MHQALHLKYRPRTFAELVGQDYIQTALTNAVTQGQIAPAYLFTGPRGTGKTSTARILAKSLNCLESKHPTASPCGKCQSCKTIEKSTNLDVSEIDAASHNGVDDARELIEHSNFAPTQSRYRVFIVDECHQLTKASQNCLLKAIEEPPAHVVFILCTTELHKVLPTIISRCQTFNFKALSLDAIVNQLQLVAEQESIAITDEALFAIARTVDGGLRDALQLLSQLSLLNEEITPAHVIEVSGAVPESDLVNIFKAISAKDVLGMLQSARGLVDSGKTPKLILSSLLQVYRDLLIVKSAPKSQNLIRGGVSYQHLRKLASGMEFETIDAAFSQLQKSESQLRTTINAAVWMEVCLLNLMSETSVIPKPQQGNGRNPALNGSTPETSKDLNAIWTSVVEAAKPTNRGLLSRAKLTALDQEQAVLSVEPKYAAKFKANSKLVGRMMARTLGYSVTVAISQKP
ncbi:MAG: DNA polymerase III subunit gamma/tau [Xenococcaceae cyanobacterium]